MPAPTPATPPEPDPAPIPEPALEPVAAHLISRFSYGHTPELADDVRRAGDARAWFDQQLAPASISDPDADVLRDWWRSLSRTPDEIAERNAAQVEGAWQVMQDFARWTLLRRIRSRRQVHETMVDFWSNQLYVPALAGADSIFRLEYDAVVRQHALGRFDDLLVACITHPSMLCYLDGDRSTKAQPNENLGRELLELHTVGVESGFTERDVRDSARILTGWWVDSWNTWKHDYLPQHHATGPVEVLDFTDPNDDPDGRETCERFLRHLARHPSTARRIARRLAVRFVQDDPPQALVDRLADRYLAAGTAIVPVLTELVASAEFAAAAGRRVRTFGEDLVATYRALDVQVTAPKDAWDAANSILWQAESGGGRPFAVAHPAGDPEDDASWTSVTRMLSSFRMHADLGAGWWPHQGVTHRSPVSWVPRFPIRLDDLTDHLSQQLLGEPASARLVDACTEMLALPAATAITEEHAVIQWRFGALLATILDSPEHLKR